MLILIPIIILSAVNSIQGCSNIIVSPGASLDRSSIVAYNADSGGLYGSLYHYPAADHPAGAKRQIYDWDGGYYRGEIDEVPHTYNVVGNVNEYGLVIGETTYGGISALCSQSAAIMDYGSLIWVTLQRAKTAREAIKTLGDLMAKYGYGSEGESFSIADPNEAFVMEIIGKGNYDLGAVWVAIKVPDGYVSAHANQARITTFSLHDPDTFYAPDTISFAKRIGLYPETSSDEEFSFSDVYDPITFSGARFCDARVWSFFGSIMGDDWAAQYLDYAQGYNLTNRMPLFVQPSSKISISAAMEHMRNHFEGTALDMTGSEFSDVGASFSATPVRSHPLTWSSSASGTSRSYLNERPIATQQTGWNFVAQSRSFVPRELAGLLWFGVDDASTTVRFPIYGSSTKLPSGFAGKGPQDGVTPPMMKFSWDSAFYVFNAVANWCYSRWDLMYPEVYSEIIRRENLYIEAVKAVDTDAINLYESKGPQAAIDFVTDFAVEAGNKLVKEWAEYFGQLFVKYRDGYVITQSVSNLECGCSVSTGDYSEEWRDRIVDDTGSHYLIPDSAVNVKSTKFESKSKLQNRKVQ